MCGRSDFARGDDDVRRSLHESTSCVNRYPHEGVKPATVSWLSPHNVVSAPHNHREKIVLPARGQAAVIRVPVGPSLRHSTGPGVKPPSVEAAGGQSQSRKGGPDRALSAPKCSAVIGGHGVLGSGDSAVAGAALVLRRDADGDVAIFQVAQSDSKRPRLVRDVHLHQRPPQFPGNPALDDVLRHDFRGKRKPKVVPEIPA